MESKTDSLLLLCLPGLGPKGPTFEFLRSQSIPGEKRSCTGTKKAEIQSVGKKYAGLRAGIMLYTLIYNKYTVQRYNKNKPKKAQIAPA